MATAERLKKSEALDHWRNLKDQPQPAGVMHRVPYKHVGSTYDQDGIRLTGSRQFIDSVLYQLRPLLERENNTERLQLVYSESTDRDTGQPTGTWNCYIQVHERGAEAKYLNTMYGRIE